MKFKAKLKNKDLTLTIVLTVGILVALNFFSYHFFHRWDLTANQNYSLSDTSKEVARSLPDVVQVKLYFSEDLPQEYAGLRQQVLDILNEYSNYSGNFRVEVLDKINDVDAYRLGIPKLQFNVLKKDKFQVVNGYLGMSVEYYDRQEVIPVVGMENLEYQLTTIIKKLTSDELPIIGFVTSHQTTGSERITGVQDDLGKIYNVQSVDLATVEKIDEGIKTLILVNPLGSFSDADKRKLDDFLLRGNSLFVTQDKQNVSNLKTTENPSNLNEFLQSYGLKINNELVLDQSNVVARFNQGAVTFSMNYPFWVNVINDNFNQDNPATSRLDGLVLPWASSVSYQQQGESQPIYLAKTTGGAWSVNNDFNLLPNRVFTRTNPHQYDLALGVSGVKSAYRDEFNQDARIIVVGDSEFLLDDFLRLYPYNKIFFLNMVDYLSLDQDLINIRSKKIVEHPVKELPDWQKQLVKYGNVFGITVIVIIFGVARYYLRKRSNNFKL